MSIIEWIATVLGIACVGLGVVRSVWTFPFGIVSVVLVGIVVLRERLYSDALLQVFYVAANLYGWRNWSQARAVAGTVRVEVMRPVQRLHWLVGGIVATLVWGALMHRYTDAAYPWWDGGVTVVSLAAQVLMARRRLENWWLWIAVDVAAMPLYAIKGLWLFAGLYLIYLGLSVWGLIGWTREWCGEERVAA